MLSFVHCTITLSKASNSKTVWFLCFMKMDEQQLTPALKLEATHIRMARVGVKLSIRELAELATVNKATIVRIEAGNPSGKVPWNQLDLSLKKKGLHFGNATVWIRWWLVFRIYKRFSRALCGKRHHVISNLTNTRTSIEQKKMLLICSEVTYADAEAKRFVNPDW